MSRYDFGPFRLDTERRRLTREGEPVRLTPKAFDTLSALVSHAGCVLEKDDLIKVVWPETFVEEDSLTQNISTIRKALGDLAGEPDYIATMPRRGYQFVAPVTLQDVPVGRPPPAPITGAMPIDDPHYVRRAGDDAMEAAVARGDSVILIKGARQIGKTSLLARGLAYARTAGARVVMTDFQDLGLSDLESSSALWLSLARSISETLGVDRPDRLWSPEDSGNTNFGRFMRRTVLDATTGPIVWGLDEVDRLFSRTFGPEVFGLFRSWHNRRALDPDGPWHRLTLAIAYASEAHLFITDANQSPFNIGTRIALDDFTLAEVAHLNRLHGSPLDEQGVRAIHAFLAGHPFLTQRAIQEVDGGMGVESLLATAGRDDGPFADHLHRIAVMLRSEPGLCATVRRVLDRERPESVDAFCRLRSAGILIGDSPADARLRCPLYAAFLSGHLL